MRKDKDVVMAAVQQSWQALKHEAEELKKDKELVMVAAQKNG